MAVLFGLAVRCQSRFTGAYLKPVFLSLPWIAGQGNNPPFFVVYILPADVSAADIGIPKNGRFNVFIHASIRHERRYDQNILA